MTQWTTILKRLKNPSVLLSIASQIGAMLMLFHVNVDMNLVTGLLTAVFSVLALLGIVSNPDTETKGYGDDLAFCKHCNQVSAHVTVAGKPVCKVCGTVLEREEQES